MKKTAKFFSLLLAAVIAMSAFSISGFAVATELEAGNSQETAANIPEFGVEYVSSLSEAGEVDWFKFTTLPDDAYYSYTLKNYNMPYYNYGEVGNSSIAPNIFLFDEFLQQVDFSYNNSYRNFKLEPNTEYYIKVLNGDKNSTGNYSVIIDYRYDSVPNEKAGAVTLQLNESSVNTFDGWYDVDWFKFITTVSGEYVFKLKNHDLNGYKDDYPYGNTDLSPNIVVCDKYDLTLGSSNNNTTFTLILEEDTEYFIKMFMGSSHNKEVGTYEISVTSPKSLTSISLVSAPSKTEYLIGDTLNVNGLSVEAAYSDGTKKTVEGYSITGFDSSTAGKKTVTISYTENGVTCTCSFDVTVIEPAPAVELTSIAYVTLPEKTTYKVGEGLNDNGLTVSARYSDGTTKLINGYTLSGFDSSTAGVKTVTVSYTENGITKTCTFSVTVLAEKKLIAVSVASMPTKTVYQTGEEFDASGLIVNAFYDDGTTAFVTDYTLSGFDSETAGTKTVVVAYTDKDVTKSCTFEVTVEEAADEGNFFTDFFNSIMNFFMSIIEFFTSLLG